MARGISIVITHSSKAIGFILLACTLNNSVSAVILAAGAGGDHVCVVCF